MSNRVGLKDFSRDAAPPSSDERGTPPPDQPSDELMLPALARKAVETFVLERRILEPNFDSLPAALKQPSACFVSLKTVERELRGCIGTIQPERNTLAEEIIRNALGAATRDPRFHPVSAVELPFLRYSVDVLDSPEPARLKDLDPKIYGVVVEDGIGSRHGLLLPDIEGVETATQQIQIAARKAHIPLNEPLKLFRFRVRRFKEAAAGHDQT